MSDNLRKRGIRRSDGASLLASVAAGALTAMTAAGPAAAQDLTFHFIDPSFGGNPFYSDHLLATATVTRPAAPSTPTPTQTTEEQIAATLRAQLLSSLSGTIQEAINNAKVGDSNTYTFGNQMVSYKKTSTETDVTFTNTDTGAVNTIVIPSTSSTSSTTAAAVAAARVNAAATSTNIALAGSLTGIDSGMATTGANAGTGATHPSAEQILSASSPAAGAGSVLPPL